MLVVVVLLLWLIAAGEATTTPPLLQDGFLGLNFALDLGVMTVEATILAILEVAAASLVVLDDSDDDPCSSFKVGRAGLVLENSDDDDDDDDDPCSFKVGRVGLVLDSDDDDDPCTFGRAFLEGVPRGVLAAGVATGVAAPNDDATVVVVVTRILLSILFCCCCCSCSCCCCCCGSVCGDMSIFFTYFFHRSLDDDCSFGVAQSSSSSSSSSSCSCSRLLLRPPPGLANVVAGIADSDCIRFGCCFCASLVLLLLPLAGNNTAPGELWIWLCKLDSRINSLSVRSFSAAVPLAPGVAVAAESCGASSPT